MASREEIEQRVKIAQQALDDTEQAVEALSSALDHFDASAGAYRVMRDYYGSDEWFSDVEAHNKGTISQEFNAHILSEDGAYDVIGERHELALRLLETGIRILRQY